MKKILAIILSVLFLLPAMVKADMSAPPFYGFDAYVSNKEGAKCLSSGDEEKILPYETEIYVDYLYDDTAQISIKGDDDYYTISVKDIAVLFDKVTIDGEGVVDISKDNKYARVLEKAGVKGYKGPATLYDNVTTIPFGSKIKIEGYLKNEFDADEYDEIIWYYVDFNGVKAWIEDMDNGDDDEGRWSIGGKIGFEVKDKLNLYTIARINLKDSNGKKVTIPAETRVTNEDFYTISGLSESVYFYDFDGAYGYVNKDDLYIKEEGEIKLEKKTKFLKINSDLYLLTYDYYDKKAVISTIKKGTIVKTYGKLYSNSKAKYIEYKGKKGIIISPNKKDKLYTTTTTTTTTEQTTTTTEVQAPVVQKKSPEKFIIMCVIGALALSITAVVILILIKKKKNKKIDYNVTVEDLLNDDEK